MSAKNTKDVVDNWWKKLSLKVNTACVFLDEPAAESLHWHGGLDLLLNAGAVAVKNFSPFEVVTLKLLKSLFDTHKYFRTQRCSVKSSTKKAVFVVTKLLVGEAIRTLENIIRASNFKVCFVITSSPEKCHLNKPDGDYKHTFSNISHSILKWMGNMNYLVEILYIPVLALCLSSDVFIIPSLSKRFSPLGSIRDNIVQEKGNMETHESVKILVHFLFSFLEDIQMKADIFSLGSLSHIIGTELENLFHTSKHKVANSKCSLFIIDRSLDLAGPLSQATESLFDRILRVLPSLPGHVIDVSINMSSFASASDCTVFDRPLLAPGCLAHRSTSLESAVLDAILFNRQKEAIMEIYRKIVEVASKEKLAVDVTSRPTIEVLKQKALDFRDVPTAILKHCGLLQQIFGIIEAHENSMNGYLDNLLGTEKLLLQDLSLSQDSASDNIVQLISNRKEKGFRLEDILILIAFLFALYGNSIFKDKIGESLIQANIVEALFQEDSETKDFSSEFVVGDLDDQNVLSSVKAFFNIVKEIAQTRKDMKKYNSVFQTGDSALPAIYVPLLKQVLEDVFTKTINEMPDVEFHSAAGLRDIIKTGFSLFMNVAKPRPCDNPQLIIFVLGGITASEAKLIRDIAMRQKKIEVIIGSTNLLTPESVMQEITDIMNVAIKTNGPSELFM